ncbi:MAG: hypothetical protein ACLP0B_24255 [Steroidobacteraceae bacterium]|jgi:hypothetical protein
MAKLKWTVAIRPGAGEKLRKITKIIGLNGDGFSVLAPYHRARSGYLFKHLMDLQTLGERKILFDECVGFTAEDRVKLTYHVDGFAQFSSENPGKIISGRDPKTGEPKGLGLLTHSLKSPIVSGASVGVTVWGLDEFETAEDSEAVISFEPDEAYYRRSTPRDANVWHLAIYAFPVGCVPPLRFEGDQPVMEFLLNRFSAGVQGAIVKMKTIYLEKEQVYLGLYVERFIANSSAKSGWRLHGPGNYTLAQSGYVLHAVYPRNLTPPEGTGSLDRVAPTPVADDAQSPTTSSGESVPD